MPDRSSRAAGIAYVVASATAFGAMAIFARYAYRDGVDTTTLLALRFSIAGALLVVACVVARVDWPRGRDLATLVTPVGGRSLGNYIFAGLESLNYTTVVFGCVMAGLLAVVLDQLVHLLEMAA